MASSALHSTRCSETGINGISLLVVYIDDKELDAEAFLDLIKPFAGWGMRITFMDETQVYDEPSVIVRDPDSSD